MKSCCNNAVLCFFTENLKNKEILIPVFLIKTVSVTDD